MIAALLVLVGEVLAADWVMVAARELPPGARITEDGFYAVAPGGWEQIPEDAMATPDDVVGRIPLERILVGEVIRAARLVDPDAPTRPSYLVAGVMRAVTVPARDAAAAQVDTFVDVVGTGCVWFEFAFVTGTPSTPEPFGTPDGTVALLVDAPQAELLAWATRDGPVGLTVRPQVNRAANPDAPRCAGPPTPAEP